MKKVLLTDFPQSAFSFPRSINSALESSRIRFRICACIFFSYLLCFAPGGMSPDSVVQFNEAMSGNFHNWHPPVMAVLWRVLLFFQQGPLPFLTFHLLMLFIACWVLSGTRTREGGYQWLWIFLPLLPQVYGNLGMIWKDIGMALALFMAFAMYCAWGETHRKRFFVLGLLFVLYALLVRHNGLTAIIPPTFFMALFFFTRKRFLKAIAATAGVSLLCLMIPLGFNYFACKSMTSMPARVTIIDEISVTSLYAKKNLFFNTIKLSELPLSDFPSFPIQKGWDFYRVDANEKDLVPNLVHVITHHPLDWIRAKFSLFSHFSSFPNQKKDAWAYNFFKDAPEQIRNSTLRNILMKIVNVCMDNAFLRIFFLPIFWVPAGIVLFIAGLLRRDASGMKMMLLTSSGLGYYAGFFIAIPTPDYRYFLWLNLSVISALLVWYYAPRALFMGVKRQKAEAS